MMTAMVLTPVQAANFRASGAFVVRGDLRPYLTPESDLISTSTHRRQAARKERKPRRGWVAPAAWTVHTGPCDKCGGTASVEGKNIASHDVCPDCVNGSKIIELWEPAGRVLMILLVARVSITVLPVTHKTGIDRVTVFEDGRCLITRMIKPGSSVRQITLDPLPQSDSDFVVVCTTVEGT